MPTLSNIGAIIFDSSGGITLHMGSFAHHYVDPRRAAEDLRNWLASPDTLDWDGHEIDAADCQPTIEAICNDEYRMAQLDRNVDTTESVTSRILALTRDWRHGVELALAVMEGARMLQKKKTNDRKVI